MSDGCIKKSRYERTIKTLEDTFAQENIHYEFYERLFSSESQNRIQDFLGLNLGAFQNSEVINATPKDKPLPQEINQQLIKTLQPTYEFLNTKAETIANRQSAMRKRQGLLIAISCGHNLPLEKNEFHVLNVVLKDEGWMDENV